MQGTNGSNDKKLTVSNINRGIITLLILQLLSYTEIPHTLRTMYLIVMYNLYICLCGLAASLSSQTD